MNVLDWVGKKKKLSLDFKIFINVDSPLRIYIYEKKGILHEGKGIGYIVRVANPLEGGGGERIATYALAL